MREMNQQCYAFRTKKKFSKNQLLKKTEFRRHSISIQTSTCADLSLVHHLYVFVWFEMVLFLLYLSFVLSSSSFNVFKFTILVSLRTMCIKSQTWWYIFHKDRFPSFFICASHRLICNAFTWRLKTCFPSSATTYNFDHFQFPESKNNERREEEAEKKERKKKYWLHYRRTCYIRYAVGFVHLTHELVFRMKYITYMYIVSQHCNGKRFWCLCLYWWLVACIFDTKKNK